MTVLYYIFVLYFSMILEFLVPMLTTVLLLTQEVSIFYGTNINFAI